MLSGYIILFFLSESEAYNASTYLFFNFSGTILVQIASIDSNRFKKIQKDPKRFKNYQKDSKRFKLALLDWKDF